jgi:putative oxidoreductase
MWIWILAVLLGLFFVLVGVSKLTGPSGDHWAVRLLQWGFPAGSRYVIGGVEVVAGLGLLVPFLRRPAATALTVVMAGALVTHLIHGEFIRVLPPLIFGGLSYLLYRWQSRVFQKA